MKKILLTVAMMFACIATFAQHAVGSVTIQPKVGMNIASMTDMDDGDMRIGAVLGAEFEYQLTDIFSLSAGALYSMQGIKASEDGVKATLKLDYINIPILANIYVAKNFALKAGLQPAFNIKNTITGKYQGVTASTGNPIDAKTLEVAMPIGASYEFNNVVIDARYNWGLTKVFDGADSRNSVFQLSIGYKFNL